ncbi:MAG: phosphoglucomutase/phosphomannomutase family protein [Bacteroidetes bacterium]|nr:phosphoglucomutase/phosphomannomutase family protein [Bacteroidota bacterium]
MSLEKIKFGTDGWRAIIAKEFTVKNVARVTDATAIWLKKNYENPSVVVGHDCRFAGELFANTVAQVLIAHGVKVYQSKDFVSTPMISMGAVEFKTSLGIIITASHNPPSYNGYKLKGSYGGPLTPEKVQEIEDIIPEKVSVDYESVNLEEASKAGKRVLAPLEDMYVKRVEDSFDIAAIKKSGMTLAYDSMYGAGQRVMTRLFPEIIHLHNEHNPSFYGQAPEPIHKNLTEFSNLIKTNGKIDCGLCTDGDADRIGLYNAKGDFVDSHHIILLLVHYLVKYKGQKAKVCTAFSTTVKLKNMCAHYGLELEVVKIGFKYICGIMLEEDVLVGGEESGGIAIKGHIPERDGIWMGLVIWEFMAKTGKSLDELIQEVYDITGTFWFERNDMHVEDGLKNKIIDNCKKGVYTQFGKYKVIRVEDMDGFKFFFDENTWTMLRASGTEPVLRIYAEGKDKAQAFDILEEVKKVIFA